MTTSRSVFAGILVSSVIITSCGGNESSSATDVTETAPAATADSSGIRVVAPAEAAATTADPPEGLVILDVRTQDEFDEGHIAGAVMLDFYRDDFADALATFDPEVPYVLYCRSGNRSSGAREIMSDLGFRSVEDVDGGIVGWQDAGLPVVSG